MAYRRRSALGLVGEQLPPLLKAVHVANKSYIIVTIMNVRESKAGFGSPLMLDVAEEFSVPSRDGEGAEVTSTIPINKTIIRAMAHDPEAGDDYGEWVGKRVKLNIIEVDDPNTPKTRENPKPTTAGFQYGGVVRTAPKVKDAKAKAKGKKASKASASTSAPV